MTRTPYSPSRVARSTPSVMHEVLVMIGFARAADPLPALAGWRRRGGGPRD